MKKIISHSKFIIFLISSSCVILYLLPLMQATLNDTHFRTFDPLDRATGDVRTAGVPSLLGFSLDGTDVYPSGSYELVRGGQIYFNLTPSEALSSANLSIRALIDGELQQLDQFMAYNSSGGNWFYFLETSNMDYGTYDIVIGLTSGTGQPFTQNFQGVLRIVPPPDPTLWIVLIVVAIAAASVGGGYVLRKKIPQWQANKRETGADVESASKRRGTIYKGASSIGRASGDEAETILAKRNTRRGAPVPPPNAAPATPLPRSAAEQREHLPQTQTLSGAETFQTLGTNATQKEIKAIEQKTAIDLGKKVDFLEGRIIGQENVMGVVVSLVEMLPEHLPCPICQNPLPAGGWAQCPWCLVESYGAELELKMSISGVDTHKSNSCPQCHMPLNPAWAKCPYCATRGK